MINSVTALLLATAALPAAKPTSDICAASWGDGRLDVFGIANDKSIWHKYYPGGLGAQWEPSSGFENMKGTVPTYGPSAVSWGMGRLDYFVIGEDKAAYHKYWDGSGNWNPVGRYHERLEGKFTSGLAAASWAEGRIDLIGRGSDNAYYHLFFDGNDWKPTMKDWEDLGGNFTSKPAAISWGNNRLDVIGITVNGTMGHKYRNGESWQPSVDGWEDFGGGPFTGDPVITSMAENRFDMWAAGEDGALYHKYWNGMFYSGWENLGGNFSTAPKVVHISPGQTQIVGQFDGNDAQYQFKYFDGISWQPDITGWFPKGGNFASQPAVVSTRLNEFNIFGIGNDGQLYLQFWTGYDYQPSPVDYYPLGDTNNPYPKDFCADEHLIGQDL